MDSSQTQAQENIIAALQVVPPFVDAQSIQQEAQARVQFIKQCLLDSGLKSLVLGISGGVDSLLAGRLSQLAVQELRAETGDAAYRFIAVRLPYQTQHDADDAEAAIEFIQADESLSLNIEAGVEGIWQQIQPITAGKLAAGAADFAKGNVKARVRMTMQYALANAYHALVVGTDQAAESVMGFFTKFGDGACDLQPLSGLVKSQVRALARALGAPEYLVEKVPTGDLEDLQPLKPDEQAYGVSYAEIDAFLHGQSIAPESAERIIRAYSISQHKRSLPKMFTV